MEALAIKVLSLFSTNDLTNEIDRRARVRFLDRLNQQHDLETIKILDYNDRRIWWKNALRRSSLGNEIPTLPGNVRYDFVTSEDDWHRVDLIAGMYVPELKTWIRYAVYNVDNNQWSIDMQRFNNEVAAAKISASSSNKKAGKKRVKRKG